MTSTAAVPALGKFHSHTTIPGRPPCGMRRVADWQEWVASTMPPPEMVVERNASINAHYASWYKAHNYFKWAGMASFSSSRAGLVLSPYRIMADAGKILRIENPSERFEDVAAMMPNLNLLRLINNAVFLDLGWAHQAYIEQGLEALAAAIGTDPHYKKLLQGFRLIDRGRRMKHSGRTVEGEQTIWEGNIFLLLHEQVDIVQPFLPPMTPVFSRFLSAMTVLEFWANPCRVYPDKMTAFYLAMFAFGRNLLLSTNSMPDFRNLHHRWFWIAERAVPIFRRLDGRDPEILQSVDEIIRRAATTLTAPAAGRVESSGFKRGAIRGVSPAYLMAAGRMAWRRNGLAASQHTFNSAAPITC